MAICFIFTQDLDETQCCCLRIDQQGRVDAPLMKRSIEETRALQAQSKTIVVVPGEHGSVHRLELPWLGERKAREAIPYALEDKLAQAVSTLHFAFDKQHYQDNQYLIVAIDKLFLTNLIDKLDSLGLSFDKITLDWFALKHQEVAAIQDRLLVSTDSLQAVLTGDIVKNYLKQLEPSVTLHTFADTDKDIAALYRGEYGEQSGLLWIAGRLTTNSSIDLCQDNLRRDSRQQSAQYWYKLSAILLGILLACFTVSKMVYLHSLNRRIQKVDDKIAVIYRQFFPHAAQVISPRFRISQLLENNAMQSDLWPLLEKFSEAMRTSNVKVQQYRFQNKVLTVTLRGGNFSVLEHLQSKLQQQQFKVTQLEASTQKKVIVATWELRL